MRVACRSGLPVPRRSVYARGSSSENRDPLPRNAEDQGSQARSLPQRGEVFTLAAAVIMPPCAWSSSPPTQKNFCECKSKKSISNSSVINISVGRGTSEATSTAAQGYVQWLLRGRSVASTQGCSVTFSLARGYQSSPFPPSSDMR